MIEQMGIFKSCLYIFNILQLYFKEIGAMLFSIGWLVGYWYILDNDDFDNLYVYLPAIGVGIAIVNGTFI
jgi:hypothetical protein